MSDEKKWRAMTVEQLQAEKDALKEQMRALREKRRAIAAIEDEKIVRRRLERVADTIPEQYRQAFVNAAMSSAAAAHEGG